ncbi:MAG: TIR domain-containing protein [bacterium]|nr:TIR domain-containing protein [bacterium]MCY4104230.1 TIR domain-containing protein [bacterium]
MAKAKNLAFLMQRLADLISTSRVDPTRLTCFVCYHDADFSDVESFIRQYGTEFVPRCIGVSEKDGFVGSLDDHYIMSRVREEILGDSTVTLLLLGRETWHQRFVDWELAASLHETPVRSRNGILALPLPSMGNRAVLPDRIRDNHFGADSERSPVIYASYPATRESLRTMLDRADKSRVDEARTVDNRRPLRRTDSPLSHES